MPIELQDATISIAFESLKWGVAAILGERSSANTTAKTLMEIAGLEVPDDGKLSAAAADELGCALDKIDVAIEPDRRWGSGVPRTEEQVWIFKAAGGGPVDPNRTPYRTMRTQIEVAILAAGADGEASYEELEHALARIRDSKELSGVEKARLIAFAVSTFKNPPKQARVVKKLKDSSVEEREAIADVAVEVISSGAAVDADDVKFLERLNRSLGLPKDRIYTSLHRAAARTDEPVPINTESRVAGIPIRKEEVLPNPLPGGIRINETRLARTRRETDAVSELLAGIFTEEPAPEPPPVAASPDGVAALEGLDAPHTELVELLELRGSMTRSEFDRHAREIRLLPDGAIERINDWSFDRFDEPLIEDGDEIIVAPHLRGRISALKEKVA